MLAGRHFWVLFVAFSIKNDFVAQLHKFMASLTDTRWKMDGKTVLYIPHEGTVVPVSPTTAKNKELIHRLESMDSQLECFY